ncbi:helix-turn-helix domain-containing protein [Rubrobacter xylanophilus]|uniref:Helix-turn-helix domain-containing protein n=1 Tax=Rubrobacter xylanophilus TaxID=49319 RepID=A0A510HG07_9ACTN|nr:RodZ domain-containing protein [Rubrobacter xylanophilus]BBL78880.1 helix-turn-helix domain-containing protein [Rubrobacter xylanophilus]
MGDERPDSFNGEEEDGLRIGEILQEARRERGLSLHEVEQATKIRKRYLEGLEREDYSVLPDAVYVQGFLKTYANYLGLDGERLSQELKRRRSPRRERRMNHAVAGSGFDKPLISPGGLAEAERSRFGPAVALTLAVVLLIAVVIGALYYVGQSSQRAASPPERAAPADGERPAEQNNGEAREGGGPAPEQDRSSDTAGTAARESSPETLEVLVSVEGAPSWLSIQSDGSVVYEGIADPGFSQTFEASQEVTLTTGNAGAVRVEVNGQSVGVLGGDGEVLSRSWTLKDAAG